MGEEHGFVRDREGEGDAGHHVHHRGIILERVLAQGRTTLHVIAVVTTHQVGRDPAGFLQGVAIAQFNTGRVVPGIAVPIALHGVGLLIAVHIHHVIVADVTRAVGQLAGDGGIRYRAAGGVSLTPEVLVLQYALVRIVAVHAHTDVENDVVEGELVHDVAGHVDRRERSLQTAVIAIGVLAIEERIEARAAGGLVAQMVEANEVHQVAIPVVDQLVRGEHVQREGLRAQGIHIDDVVTIGVQTKRGAQAPVEEPLVRTNEGVIEIERERALGDLHDGIGVRGIGIRVLLQVEVGRGAGAGPESGRRQVIATLGQLLVFNTDRNGMLADIRATDGGEADLVVAALAELGAIGIIDEPDVVPHLIKRGGTIPVPQHTAALGLGAVAVEPMVIGVRSGRRTEQFRDGEGLVGQRVEVEIVEGGEIGVLCPGREGHERVALADLHPTGPAQFHGGGAVGVETSDVPIVPQAIGMHEVLHLVLVAAVVHLQSVERVLDGGALFLLLAAVDEPLGELDEAAPGGLLHADVVLGVQQGIVPVVVLPVAVIQ